MLRKLEEELRQLASSPRQSAQHGQTQQNGFGHEAITSAELTFGNGPKFKPKLNTSLVERSDTSQQNVVELPAPSKNSHSMVWTHGVFLPEGFPLADRSDEQPRLDDYVPQLSPRARDLHGQTKSSPRKVDISLPVPPAHRKETTPRVSPRRGIPSMVPADLSPRPNESQKQQPRSVNSPREHGGSPRQIESPRAHTSNSTLSSARTSTSHPASLPPLLLKALESPRNPSLSPRSPTTSPQGKSAADLRREGQSSTQGPLVLRGSGMYERQPAVGSDIWIEREAQWESARHKIARALEDPSRLQMVLGGLETYAPVNIVKGLMPGWVTAPQMEDCLRRLHARLTREEIKEVVRRLDEAAANRIEYEKALVMIRNSEANPVAAPYLADRRRTDASAGRHPRPPPPAMGPERQERNQLSPRKQEAVPSGQRIGRKGEKVGAPPPPPSDDGWGPFLVFALGWLVFPVWCLGWMWVRSASHKSQLWGRASAFLAMVWSALALAVGVGLSLQKPIQQQAPAAHCPGMQGVVAAIKAKGPSAKETFFWNQTTSPPTIIYQIRLKSVIQELCLREGLPTHLTQDCVVMLDGIKRLIDDPDGATLVIAFKIGTMSLANAQALRQLVPGWIQSGQLKTDLETRGIYFEQISFLDSAPDFDKAPKGNPTVFQQSRVFWFVGSPNWMSTFSTGLMRQPPTALLSNVMDPHDEGWTSSQTMYLQTCWMMALVQIREFNTTDPTRGNPRTLQVVLKTNQSSAEIFHVWVRQNPADIQLDLSSTVLQNVPSPTWLMDDAGIKEDNPAVLAKPSRDIASCGQSALNNLGACSVNYAIDIDVAWTGRSYYWIGVTGQSYIAQYVPFELLVRVREQ